jgi:hypothetical protein
METFAKLFARFLVFVYHCFDRIVIQGYMPLLTRPEHIVHFFRDLHGQYPITPQVLAKRTPEYRGWVEAYARNHKIPMLKAEKGVSKEKCVLPHLERMERRNQHGVYCIFTSMEMGNTFRSQMPWFPTDDPDYRIIRRVPSRFLHYYFYIRDPVIGPLAMCVGTYLPFQTTYYKTAGHVLGAVNQRLGGGYWLRVPVFGWYTSLGKCLEGAGVRPDRVIDVAQDPVAAAADYQILGWPCGMNAFEITDIQEEKTDAGYLGRSACNIVTSLENNRMEFLRTTGHDPGSIGELERGRGKVGVDVIDGQGELALVLKLVVQPHRQ